MTTNPDPTPRSNAMPTDTLWTPAEARRADLGTLHSILLDHKGRIEDFVIGASSLTVDPTAKDTMWAEEVNVDLGADGVTRNVEQRGFRMSDLAHVDLSSRLDVPMRYWRRMQNEETPSLLAANANYWLQSEPNRKLMLRTYRVEEGQSYLRAILSDRYARMDDEDMLAATLVGIREAGLNPADVQIDGDITEKRLRVRITAPSIGVNVGDLLGDYRSPFGGGSARDLPMMWAGLEVANSETGRGAWSITPRVVLQVCTNGMTRRMDVSRRTHLGERLEEGVVEWSQETQQRTLALIQSKTRDAVHTFLSTDYLDRVAAEMREKVGIVVSQPLETLPLVAKATGLTDGETNDLIRMFMVGGESTALGVGHAITALAQNVEDSDRASDLEASFWSIVSETARVEAHA